MCFWVTEDWDKIEVRGDSWESSSLPVTPRAPQLNLNLLSLQKHINSDWARV